MGETAFVAAAAERSASSTAQAAVIGGIIAYADLRVPDIDDPISAHLDAGRGRFRGVRQVASRDDSSEMHTSHPDPPVHLLADPAFRRGLVALGRAGQCLDACLYHLELADAGRAASETVIALDHMGAPPGIGPYAGKRQGVLAVWRRGMIEVARCENVVVKLGGIGMPIFGRDWLHRDVEPSSVALAEAWGGEMRWCIDQFGVERCMCESNFSVDKRSCTYLVLWNAFKRMMPGASASDNAALFYENAERIYCLRVAVSSGGRLGGA